MNAKLGLTTFLVTLSLAACSSNRVVHAPVEVTVGQQLIDLKKAHASGALSDEEYDQQRYRLIQSVR